MTFTELIDFFERNTLNLPAPQKKNKRSALSQFQKHYGLNDGDLAEPTLGTSFERSLTGFLVTREKASVGTIRKSEIEPAGLEAAFR